MAQTGDSLGGKVAIITGGARGLGLACAEALGEKGCSVLIADLDGEELERAVAALRQKDIKAASFTCDITKKQAVQALVELAVSTFGGLDIMVANAGILRAAPLLELSEEDWDAVVAVHQKGTFLCGQAAAQQFVRQNAAEGRKRGGAIINLSSVGSALAIPELASYCVSKEAINGLTRNMALAWAKHGIRVNAMGPGTCATPMVAAYLKADPARMQGAMAMIPAGRVGDPRDVGQLCAFLASDATASYITGQVIYCDGGRLTNYFGAEPPPG